MTVIIDYKTGNLGSIENMLRKIGHQAVITHDLEAIAKASKLILPGVGSFDYGIGQLEELGLTPILNKKVHDEKVPILGICLGAQLCCLSSEEGRKSGLGWIDAHVRKFPTQVGDKKYPVPHMGWDYVSPKKQSRLLEGLEEPRFYFVHSYYIDCVDPAEVLTESTYSTRYASGFEKGNILGVQFHPEKSHKYGKQLLKNFIDLY